MREKFFPMLVLLAIVCLTGGICHGKIFKYQDATGKWHYTDSPESIPQDIQPVKGSGQKSSSEVTDLKKKLYDKFAPRNVVEEATLGTVTIKTPVGLGSGFFVSDDGYILTNKHVVRLDEKIKETASDQIEKVDKRVDHVSKRFAAESAKLKVYRDSLENQKKRIDAETNPSTKAALEEKYKADQEVLDALEKDYRSRKKEFADEKEDYEKGKQDFLSKASEAESSTTFTVVLKDNSEHDAYLVSVSQNTDVALLKLTGSKTPCLKTGIADNVAQGERVYAVGSPVGLRDTVSSGVISGTEGHFLRTDARIYPGNSGGPLINKNGEVVGINTLKEITHNYEGLGYAIKINAAIKEFGRLSQVSCGE